MSKVQRNRVLFWTLACSVIVILWVFQNYITVNIPWWDDFHGIMIPVYDVFSNSSIYDKISLLFSLNNEHRIFNDRFFMLVIYLISGQFEMKWLAMLGFINLIGIFLLFYKVAKPYLPNIWYFFPVVLFIFHAQYYESLQSLMVPFQNFSVILYSLFSIYFISQNSKSYVLWAAIFSVLAIFSHGNGILTFPICAMILIIQSRRKYLIYWLLFSIIIIAAYFYNYSTPTWKLEQTHTSVGFFNSLLFGFEFLGAYSLNLVEVSSRLTESIIKKLLPALFGLFLSVAYIIVFYRKYPFLSGDFKKIINKLKYSKIDIFILGAVSFVVCTAIIMSITRASFPMLSRYTINSSIYVSVIYLFLFINFAEKKKMVWANSIFAVIMYLLSYFNNVDKALNFKQNVITDGINWQKQHTWINSYSEKQHINNLNPLLTEIFENHKYVFPLNALDNYNNLQLSVSQQNIKKEIHRGYLELSTESTNAEKQFYYTLENEQNKYIFPANKVKNSLFTMLKSMKYFSNKKTSTFPVYLTKPGTYRLYLIELSEDYIKKYKSEMTLKVNEDGTVL